MLQKKIIHKFRLISKIANQLPGTQHGIRAQHIHPLKWSSLEIQFSMKEIFCQKNYPKAHITYNTEF